jgi:hypothetical protein
MPSEVATGVCVCGVLGRGVVGWRPGVLYGGVRMTALVGGKKDEPPKPSSGGSCQLMSQEWATSEQFPSEGHAHGNEAEPED